MPFKAGMRRAAQVQLLLSTHLHSAGWNERATDRGLLHNEPAAPVPTEAVRECVARGCSQLAGHPNVGVPGFFFANVAHQATIIFGGENMATIAPFKQRRLESKNKKRAAIAAKKARDAKFAEWQKKPEAEWSIERKVANGKATNEEIEELHKEADQIRNAAHHELPQLKEKHQAAKRRMTTAKGNVTKATKYLEDAKKGGDVGIINEAEASLESAQKCLEDKESTAKMLLHDLETLAKDLHSSNTRRRIAWLEKNLPACSIGYAPADV